MTLLQSIRELKDAGVAVLFEEQSIYTLSAEGELMLSVLGAITEEERKTVCSNVQWAMRSKFKTSEVMVNTNRLLGYDKDGHGNLLINEEQADIVYQIYTLYLEGMSAHRIARILNEENVPTYTPREWKSSRVISIISTH